MGERCGWCRVCCYSTPYATIFALSVTVVGLVGFLSSAVYGVALMNNSPALQNYTAAFAPVVGGVAGTTTIPLVIATILAYCVTGYARDELYHPLVKSCVGPMCSVWVVILTFVYFLVWLCLSMLLALLLAVYIELRLGCSSISNLVLSPSEGCYRLSVQESAVDLQICGDLGTLCRVGVDIGLALAIAMGFALLVVIGLVLILIVQAANFVNVRESNKRSYQPKGNY